MSEDITIQDNEDIEVIEVDDNEVIDNVALEALLKGEKGDKGDTGDKGDKGDKGDDGQDGISPTATVTQSGSDAIIAITDKSGTTTATVSAYDDTEVKSDISQLQEDSHTHSNKSVIDGISSSDVSNWNSKVDKNVNNLTYYTLKTNTGSLIDLEINQTTYVVTLSLKDQDGNVINSDTIDLPLENVVVSGSYDSENEKIVLTLQSGDTVDIPVGALVAGLQSEITSSNKLASDLVDDTNSGHKFVTTSEKQTWNNKSDFSGNYNDLSNKPNIPTKYSDLTNDNNTVQDSSYVHTDNNYTTAEKTKLSGIEAQANKTIVDDDLDDTSTNPVQNKVVYESQEEQNERITNLLEQIPTKEVEGNPIYLNDSADLPLKSFSLKGDTEQSENPSPENPQEINNVEGTIIITKSNSDNTQTKTYNFPLSEGQKLYKGSYLADDGINNVRKQIVFDGSNDEEWVKLNNMYYITKSDMLQSYSVFTLSNYFTSGRINSSSDENDYNKIDNLSNTIRIKPQITGVSDLTSWKTWLSNNPITVQYELASKEIIPYTSAQQSVYNEIISDGTYKPVTHYIADGDLAPDMKVEYRQIIDIPTTLAELQSDNTHRTVTDTEKSTWNAKQNALTAGTNIQINSNVISSNDHTFEFVNQLPSSSINSNAYYFIIASHLFPDASSYLDTTYQKIAVTYDFYDSQIDKSYRLIQIEKDGNDNLYNASGPISYHYKIYSIVNDNWQLLQEATDNSWASAMKWRTNVNNTKFTNVIYSNCTFKYSGIYPGWDTANNTTYITGVPIDETTINSYIQDMYIYRNNNWVKVGQSDFNNLFSKVNTELNNRLNTNKVKTTTSTTSGDVYDVTYINTMIGNIETLLGGI